MNQCYLCSSTTYWWQPVFARSIPNNIVSQHPCFALHWRCVSLLHPVSSHHRDLYEGSYGTPNHWSLGCWSWFSSSSRRNTIAPHNTQHTSSRRCVPLKRKCILIWKRVTQAARPAERFSFIPTGFILVTRSSRQIEQRNARGEVEQGRRELSVKSRWQRLKKTICFEGWSAYLFGFGNDTGAICGWLCSNLFCLCYE